jgi:glucosamine--fructose-6-phosphate aminotransferase (isomerizing)
MSSLLEEEIMSQPSIISGLLQQEVDHIGRVVAKMPSFNYVLIAARGSSDHAALYAKYAWAALGGIPIALATPSLYTLYGTPPRMDGSLVIGISQSGQSPDIVAVLEAARQQGRPTLAITNDGASPLAAAADDVVTLHVDQEKSVAATKTYTAELAVLAAFAAHLSGKREYLDDLKRLPQVMESTLRQAGHIARQTERYRYMNSCSIIGRGYNYATSFELALKLKELTYVMSNAYSSADFRHGPIATVEVGSPVILVMPAGKTYDDLYSLAGELQLRGAELLIISNTGAALELAKTALPISSDMPEWLSPIAAIIPGQLLALHLALAKGLDPDLPRGLQKVTRTT